MQTNTIIVGASAAGLACASCLKKTGIPYVLLEQHSQVAHSWRHHYDRLHLHTNRTASGLPHWPMPTGYPKYPSRDQVVKYLEDYCERLALKPRFHQTVQSIHKIDDGWTVGTQDEEYTGQNIIIASGYNRKPIMPEWAGQNEYRGEIIHSSDYRNGEPYRDKKVLVVGFGNSACEIVICLHEHGAHPNMSVRSPVNIIPRDILGIPVLSIGIFMSFLPPRLADKLNAPLIRLLVGDYTRYGLRKPDYGPIEQIVSKKKIPLLDIGTVDLIKQDKVKVYGEIESFFDSGILFKDGTREDFEAVILGTGYSPLLKDFFPDFDNSEFSSGKESKWPGVFFCGFYVSPTGMLREIGLEAQALAKNIKIRSA